MASDYATVDDSLELMNIFLPGPVTGLTAYIFLGTSITNPVFLIPTIIFFAILIGTSWYIKKRSSLAKKLKKELEENK